MQKHYLHYNKTLKYTASRYRLLQDGSFVFWQLTYSVSGIFCLRLTSSSEIQLWSIVNSPILFSTKVTGTLASVWLPNSKNHDYIIDYHNFMVIIMSDIRRLFIPTHFVASSSWHNRKKSKLLSGKACLIFPKVIKLRQVVHNGNKAIFNWQMNSILRDIFDIIFNICSKHFATLGKIKQALLLKSLDFLQLCHEDNAKKCVGIKSLRISDIIITTNILTNNS